MEAPSVSRPQSKRKRDVRYQVLTHGALIFLSLLFLIPLVWMISTSLKPIMETMKLPPRLFPEHVQWQNYGDAMSYNADKLGYIPFLVYARNTLVICILAVAGTVISNAIV